MKSNLMKLTLMFIVVLIFAATVCFADGDKTQTKENQMSVQDIVEKANLAAYYAGDDGKSDVKMKITDKQGRIRTREFTILRKDIKDGGEQKFYVHFRRPGDYRNMVFMVWKNIKTDDDRWLYMKNLDLVKRIAASDKRTSFVGSDYLYEDVSGRSLTEDKHTLISTDDKYYVIKNVPKNKDNVEFSHYLIRIDKTNFLPLKAEYYKGDKLYRVITGDKIERIQDIPTVTQSTVKNIETGSQTVNTFSNIKYNLNIPDAIFSKRFLRRAPTRWLRK